LEAGCAPGAVWPFRIIRKSLLPAQGIEPQIVQPVAQAVYRLCHSGSSNNNNNNNNNNKNNNKNNNNKYRECNVTYLEFQYFKCVTIFPTDVL
jgi:hypothetical protein